MEINTCKGKAQKPGSLALFIYLFAVYLFIYYICLLALIKKQTSLEKNIYIVYVCVCTHTCYSVCVYTHVTVCVEVTVLGSKFSPSTV